MGSRAAALGSLLSQGMQHRRGGSSAQPAGKHT